MCDECFCFFCNENLFYLNEKVNLPTFDSIIYEDEYVFVTPDIAPVCRGHYLIVSKEHFNSFGNAGPQIINSAFKAAEYIKKSVYKSNSVLLFEHGAVVSHSAGSCIDHAHIHVVPPDINISVKDINDYIAKTCFVSSQKVEFSTEVLAEFAKKKQPYLFYSTLKSEQWLIPVQRLPSQFFRALISFYVGRQYNWKLLYKSQDSKRLFSETLMMQNDK